MTQNYRLFIDGHFPEPVVQPSGALVMGLGNSTARALTSASDKNFLQFYLENSSTGTSNRGLYLREYLSGTGGGGEALRVFTSVQNVAGSTAHGAHVSLNFGTSGSLTGQGFATRHTLHIPNTQWTANNVSYGAIEAEIWCDGSDSDPQAQNLSFIHFNSGGHADGMADVDTDAFLFNVQGLTAAKGSLLCAEAPGTPAASLRVKVGATTYYLPLYSAQTA